MTPAPRTKLTVISASLWTATAGACLLAVTFAFTFTGAGCAKVQQVNGGGTGGRGGSTPGPMPGIPNLDSISVTPATQTLPLAADASGGVMSGSKSFTAQGAFKDGTNSDVTSMVNWSVSPRMGSTIVNGTVTLSSPGTYTVTASSGNVMGSAQVTATFSGTRMGAGFVASNMAKLDGSTSGSVSVAYPLDGAIFPSNFGKVTFQIPRSGNQDIARLSFVGGGLDIKYYGVCEPAPNVGGGCYVTVQSDLTKWFVGASAQEDIALTARLGSSGGGSVAESPAIKLAWADVALSGGLYYWTTITPGAVAGYTPPDPTDLRGTAVMRYNFSGDMPARELVWTDRGSPRTVPPFQESPPAQMGSDQNGRSWGEGRCIGCHTISPNGELMAFSIGGSDASSWAVLNIGNTTLNLLDPTASMATMGLDALKRYRKGSFATFTTFGPNSDLMVIMYRGKLALREVNSNVAVVKDNLFASATPELKSDPFWSPDGGHFAFTSYDPAQDIQTSKFNGDTKTGGQIWAATADAREPHDDARLIVRREAGVTSYYPAISHDGSLLVFNKSQCSGPANPGNYGVGPCDGYDDITATLWLTDPNGSAPKPLTLANGAGQNSNSWPRWSPDNGGFRGRRLYWLAFSSRRAYGLQVNNGAGTGAKPQLWFTAILVGDEFGGDPSHPPVWLPDQNLSIEQPTGNHVPQWVKFVVPIQ